MKTSLLNKDFSYSNSHFQGNTNRMKRNNNCKKIFSSPTSNLFQFPYNIINMIFFFFFSFDKKCEIYYLLLKNIFDKFLDHIYCEFDDIVYHVQPFVTVELKGKKANYSRQIGAMP